MALPKILQHIINSTVHITAAERTAWNAKPSITDINSAISAANPKYTRVSYSKVMASNADWVNDWCSIDSKKYNFIVVSYEGTGFNFLIPKDNMYFSVSNYNTNFYPQLGSIPLEAAGVHSGGDAMQGYVGYSPHPTVAVRRDSDGIYYFSCNNKATTDRERTMTVTAYCI